MAMETIYADAKSLKKRLEETEDGKAELQKLYGNGDARKTLSQMKKAELQVFVSNADAFLARASKSAAKRTPAKRTPAKAPKKGAAKTPVESDDDESSLKSIAVDDIVAALANLDTADKKKVLKECVKRM
jgi:septal ring factor EnvC (AmiA/AmiB activator)